MRKIRIVSIVSLSLLVPVHLCAMDEDDSLLFNEIDSTTRPLLMPNKIHKAMLNNQNLDNSEEEVDIHSCCIPNFLSGLSNIWSYWKRRNNTVIIDFLPTEIIWKIANFLDSTDILRLSGTSVKFRKIFNENYWLTYLSKVPKSCSFLILNDSLSPISKRKSFFSHLWYSEERINLAAKLNHPEASTLRQYGSCGAYIGKDQYLCPSGVIKYISGIIDDERTNTLKEAENKKAKADMRRGELVRRQEERFMTLNSRWNGNK